MIGMLAAFALLALVGHLALFLHASNQLNARIASRTLRHACDFPLEAFLVLLPVAIVAGIAWDPPSWTSAAVWKPWQIAAGGYAAAAACIALIFVPPWLYRHWTTCPPELLRSNHTAVVDLKTQLEGRLVNRGLGRFFLSIPGNESLQVSIHEKTLEIPRLPPALDGLTITHLSDLHFTGRVGRAYFEEVARLANELESDLVAVTGDIVDYRRCLEWIPETLGRLQAPEGVYFVLGNHDLRVGAANVRQALVDCGLIDLSGRWLRHTIRGQEVLLAGNELPWIKPAGGMPDCLPPSSGQEFRIALSHSPDQFCWAQQNDVDLMLAGHTHGGQICFPAIGPILAPSRYGVRYCAGTFYLPPTVLHVSRGLSGLQPLRFNCPPELTKLVLRCGKSH